MQSSAPEVASIAFPVIWAMLASAYIMFSTREKRLFLEWSSVFRPWLAIPVAAYAIAMSVAKVQGFEISAGSILAFSFVMGSPMLALLYGKHSSPGALSAEKMVR